jgi:hypothetical protein
MPTTKVKPKTFNFTDTILSKAPLSPNRAPLLSDFLRNKLGEEKFNKMKVLLENSTHPMKILDESR